MKNPSFLSFMSPFLLTNFSYDYCSQLTSLGGIYIILDQMMAIWTFTLSMMCCFAVFCCLYKRLSDLVLGGL